MQRRFCGRADSPAGDQSTRKKPVRPFTRPSKVFTAFSPALTGNDTSSACTSSSKKSVIVESASHHGVTAGTVACGNPDAESLGRIEECVSRDPCLNMAFNAGPRLIVGRRVGLLKLHGVDPQRGGIKICILQIRPDAHPGEIIARPERHGEPLPLRADPDRLVSVAFAFAHHDTGGHVGPSALSAQETTYVAPFSTGTQP